jgi:multiple sugar transport system permease protein
VLLTKKRISRLVLWLLTLLVAFVILYPVYWIFLSSITSPRFLFSSPLHLLPTSPTSANYESLMQSLEIARMSMNTLIITILTLCATIGLGLTAAYAFARTKNRHLWTALNLLLFSVLLPAIVSIRPLYMSFNALGLIDTFLGLIILYTSAFIPLTVLILYNTIKQIPISIEESAEVDGASTLRIITTIVLPLLRPVIATLAIINFISCMNEFMIPLFFTTIRIQTLSVGITMIPRLSTFLVPWEKISALGTIIVLPIVVFVVAFEKNILAGIMSGSVKQ